MSTSTDASRRQELKSRAVELLHMTDDLAAVDLADEIQGVSLRGLDGHLAVRGGELRDCLLADALPEGARLHRVSIGLADVQTLRFEIRDFLVHERLRRLEQLEDELARLRRVHDPDVLINRVCQAAAACGGFDRVMLSRVEGSTWKPWKSYAPQREEAEQHFRTWMAAIPEIPLDHLLLESEMVRRREAVIVEDAVSDPRVSSQLREVSGHQSYVAAPLMPEGRVVGFLHADYRDGEVTPLDRDILATFARAFDQIFERAVLLQRLRQQRDEVRATLQSVSTLLDDLSSAEIELATRQHSSALAAGRRSGRTWGIAGSRLEALLTKRELEVLELVATGATNDRIAERLVISSATVKSHVKHILRKLRAENRAEAIAQYLRLTLERGED